MDCKKYQKLYKNQELKAYCFLLELFMRIQSNKEQMKYSSWFQNSQHSYLEMSSNVKLFQSSNHWFTLDIKLFVELPSLRKTWTTQRKRIHFLESLALMQTQQPSNVSKEGSKSKPTQIKTLWPMLMRLQSHTILLTLSAQFTWPFLSLIHLVSQRFWPQQLQVEKSSILRHTLLMMSSKDLKAKNQKH